MFRRLLLWPSSGWIQFLSEKLYRCGVIRKQIISVGKEEQDLILHKVGEGGLCADGKEMSR